jgi:hypothetical protein
MGNSESFTADGERERASGDLMLILDTPNRFLLIIQKTAMQLQ